MNAILERYVSFYMMFGMYLWLFLALNEERPWKKLGQ